MHRLLPPPTIEVDTDDAYRAPRPPGQNRPWVMANMIATFDGAIEVGGVSGPLGSAGDKDIFGTIRTIPDIILVGRATVAAEHYNPPSTSVSTRARRLANGAWPTARIAVISGSLDIDLTLSMFMTPQQRPLVVTTDEPPGDRLAAVSEVADVIHAGVEQVDLLDALAQLHDLGANVVLSEGGPSLNGQLLAAGVLDEVCLSIAPMAAGGRAKRITSGPDLELPVDFDLQQVLIEDQYLFCRYLKVAIS